MRILVSCLLLPAVLACGGSRPGAAQLQAGTACSSCRMMVSDQKVAGQIAAPAEEPRFFDDIGCLAAYLREHPLPDGAVAYVADHQDGAWIDARDAVYSRSDAIATPMYSHTIAHASSSARSADPAARGAAPLSPADVFGATLGGGRGK